MREVCKGGVHECVARHQSIRLVWSVIAFIILRIGDSYSQSARHVFSLILVLGYKEGLTKFFILFTFKVYHKKHIPR